MIDISRKAILLLFSLVLSVNLYANKQNLSYKITYDKTGVNVSLRFKGNDNGTTILSYFNEEKSLSNFSCNTDCKIENGGDGKITLTHRPGKEIEFKYKLNNAIRDSIPYEDETYKSIINDKYYYLLGERLFIVPDVDIDQVNLQWNNFPANWKHISSFGLHNGNITLKGERLDNLTYSIFTAGDFRIQDIKLNKEIIRLAIRGNNWAFTDQELAEQIQKMFSSQENYWKDNLPSYLITLIPQHFKNENGYSSNGRGLYHSFITMATNTRNFKKEEVIGLYQHELLHHWFGGIIDQAQPENNFKWFNEGFTDYFTNEVKLSGEFIDKVQYLENINHVFRVYYANPLNEISNLELAKIYDLNTRTPYDRGFLIALYLDSYLKQKTSGSTSLKQIIQKMMENRKDKIVFSQEKFKNLLEDALKEDLTPFFDKHIEKGLFIGIDEWQKVNPSIKLSAVPLFDLGYKTSETNSKMKIVSEVVKGSGAEKAGMKEGDRLTNWSYNSNNLKEKAAIIVKRGDETIKFEYFPIRIDLVPQIVN